MGANASLGISTHSADGSEMSRRCDTCKHFNVLETNHERVPRTEGHCRRVSPVNEYFPRVFREDVCGDWETKEGPPMPTPELPKVKNKPQWKAGSGVVVVRYATDEVGGTEVGFEGVAGGSHEGIEFNILFPTYTEQGLPAYNAMLEAFGATGRDDLVGRVARVRYFPQEGTPPVFGRAVK